MGYHRAGWEVVGVDIKPQPNYPFEFVRQDALEFLIWDRSQWDGVHASPPCPRYSSMTKVLGNPEEHPDLIGPTRELLQRMGLPYVIENVPGSPLMAPYVICGSSMGMGAQCRDGQWRQLRRHRWFETNFALLVPPCVHRGEPIGVYGNGGGQQKTVWNGGTNRGYMGNYAERCEAMEIDWMRNDELSDAIPPLYTELIGSQMIAHVGGAVIA